MPKASRAGPSGKLWPTTGETIRAYRKQAGLAQEKLAERAHLRHNLIGEVERGNMEISLGSLLTIAKALGVRGRDLLRDL
jgi:transcriptional regulator with XRE-family HTH domain